MSYRQDKNGRILSCGQDNNGISSKRIVFNYYLIDRFTWNIYYVLKLSILKTLLQSGYLKGIV